MEYDRYMIPCIPQIEIYGSYANESSTVLIRPLHSPIEKQNSSRETKLLSMNISKFITLEGNSL